ncbi:gamma-glutamylcyclotransferase family protein [Microvirga antarctica]|uniref:gamma-glutamylcyclotransferase family protein n=1 Tax=Microvirga antarctica TaxID=2819233 RepID=UPI001B3130AA|nr:gamma-glutamylcyclotransferase family protein [Microvirga antarctica]
MPLYFAYGSNMDEAAMAVRCPRSKVVGPARLMRHRFLIFSEGYASVMREPSSTTWGLVWDLAFSDLPALDRYESLSTGLYTKVVQPIVTDRGPRRALVYIGRDARPGTPRPGYMEAIVAAAAGLDFPALYMAELNSWNPSADAAARALPRPAVRPLFGAPTSTLRRS